MTFAEAPEALEGGDAADPAAGRRGIQSVGNAARILEALAGLGEASTLRAVSKASGLSTSQAHRYLASLIAAGMAQQEAASGRYDLGPAAIKLGLAALARTDALRTAEIAIAEFVKRTGRTVQVCALGPLGPTIIRWFCGVPPVVTSLNVGSVLSLLHSATGHMFVAFADPHEIAPLVGRELALEEVKRIDLDEIKSRVRRQGYATVAGVVVPGLRATAFPIFDLQGRPVLSATVIASDAFEPKGDAKIRTELGLVCAEISASLGGRPPHP
jgi:DNA-binding IclR family transcriptional regulator